MNSTRQFLSKFFFNIFFILIYNLFTLLTSSNAQYIFDWNDRLDWYGNPAGIYTTTPFPIDENTTVYTITNDEGTKTYNIGTKYFVDGLNGDDNNDGSSLLNAKKSILSAISVALTGNITIIVRGAHDGFNGIYYETLPNRFYGAGDSNRYMIVGYKQERPIIDGNNSLSILYSGESGHTNSFVTFQRLKFQNNKERGLRIGEGDSLERDGYFNLIDVYVYNCKNDSSLPGDGNIHIYGADNVWVYHCTSERTYGHGIKVADNADDCIVEWNYIIESGYWEPWTGPSSYWGNHSVGLDCAADGAADSIDNVILRYNIVETALMGTLQLRRCNNFSVHHNEFLDATHFDDVNCSEHHYSLQGSCIIHASYGNFYSNIIRDNGDWNGSGATGQIGIGLGIFNLDSSYHTNVYNNLIYNHYRSISISSFSGNMKLGFYNNSIYASTLDNLLNINSISSNDQVYVENNIFFQGGPGNSVNLDSDVLHTYNHYYNPIGSRGISLVDGETEGNPNWLALPIGPFDSSHFRLTQQLLGTDLSDFFNVDFNQNTRTRWDKGAYEYTLSATSTTTPPVDGLTATAGDSQITLNWDNPTNDDFVGSMIRYRTDGTYPINYNDGNLVCNKTATPGSNDSFTHTELQNNTTYHYSAFTYDGVPNYSEPVHVSALPAAAPTYSYIWIQAESKSLAEPISPIEIMTDETAYCKKYIWKSLGSGDSTTPEGVAQYTIDIPTAGDYVIWGRVGTVTTPDKGAHSFFVEMDARGDDIWAIPTTTNWTWRVGPTFSNPGLSFGPHVLKIKGREDGTKLDKILITNDMGYNPNTNRVPDAEKEGPLCPPMGLGVRSTTTTVP